MGPNKRKIGTYISC